MKPSISPRFQAAVCELNTARISSPARGSGAGGLFLQAASASRARTRTLVRKGLILPADVAEALQLLQRRRALGRVRLFLHLLADREHGLRVGEGLDARVHDVDRLDRPLAAQE